VKSPKKVEGKLNLRGGSVSSEELFEMNYLWNSGTRKKRPGSSQLRLTMLPDLSDYNISSIG